MGWLLFIGIIAVAWYAAQVRGELARKIVRFLPIAPRIVLGVLTFSGWGRMAGGAGDVHRWAGHTVGYHPVAVRALRSGCAISTIFSEAADRFNCATSYVAIRSVHWPVGFVHRLPRTVSRCRNG